MALSAQEVHVKFENGQWEDLESLLSKSVESDPADAKSAFRLANLFACQGKHQEALRLFDLCAAQKWPGTLAHNNKGVVHTWLGEARAAVECFRKAKGGEGGNAFSPDCKPALYNLGILYERLAADSDRVPWVVVEAQERGLESNASGIAMQYFYTALTCLWPTLAALDRPLLLWKDDVPSRFGFETGPHLGGIEEAHQFYQDGLKALENHEWISAVNLLEAAGKLWPPLAARTIEPHRRAYLELCRQKRDVARRAWEQKEFEQARRALDSLLALLPGLPDKAVIAQIFVDEIGFLVDRICTHQADRDWASLQAETAAARLIIESHGIEHMTEAGSLAERLKAACREAWGRELEYLLVTGDFEGATTFLDMGEWLWFGEQESRRLRWRVYCERVEACCREGLQALKQKRMKDAYQFFANARETAVRAGDPTLIDRCESLLVTVYPPRRSMVTATDVRELLDRGAYTEVLPLIRDRLATAPEDANLAAMRSTAIRRLLEVGEAFLRNGQWETAVFHARTVLEFEPASDRARKLEQASLKSGFSRIELLIDRGQLAEAERIFAKIFEIASNHESVSKVQHALNAAREFETMWQSFVAAREESRPLEALECYLRLRGLQPYSPSTRDAANWTLNAMTKHLEAELAANPAPAAAERLLIELEQILMIDRDFIPAQELRKKLWAASRGGDYERRLKSDDLLRRAEKALNDRDPAESSDLLRRVMELDEPVHRVDAAQCRDRALQLARRQLIPLFRQGTRESLAEADRLMGILELWDQDAVSRERETWRNKTKALEQARQADEAIETLRKSVTELAGKPLDALRLLDKRLLELKQSGLPLGPNHRRVVRTLRNDIVTGMSRWLRLEMKAYEAWRPGVRDLYKDTEDDQQ